MSGAGKTFGTQSPPLEATGEEQPMGVSSIDGGQPEAVPDSQQRKEYFQGQGIATGDDDQEAQAQTSSQESRAEKIKKD
ncbi:hypothetical protein A0H81_12644 [Grifola frondosa]|uniref:Uncharacterized protein n=1 Tax=Grifola frondosa TaxID=5627 RepID=A0A1C7LRL1_GRIFR|nr:hypothetical protein A0H81_12644 [Grifola frondosa]